MVTMKYNSQTMELEAVLQTARQMCAAARTAPKARGIDYLETCVLTADDLETLATQMETLGKEHGYDFFLRDAANVRASQAVVLIGTGYHQRGLNEGCALCRHENCVACAREHGVCVYDPIDLGIAIGSAVSIAADQRVDNRVMFSIGQAAASLGWPKKNCRIVTGIPLSVSKKSPYFDRK